MKSATPVILAGGQGDRLWPVSRQAYPKQFTRMLNETSLFQQTIMRLSASDRVSLQDPIIVTNEEYRFFVREQLDALALSSSQILLEPVGRNTAPAVLASCALALREDEEAVLLVMPSDHMIDDPARFIADVERGFNSLESGEIVLFGINPTRPETGFGYLELGKQEDGDIKKLVSFVEKPPAEQAALMVASGSYLWNSGIFLFRAKDLIKAAEIHCSETLKAASQAFSNATKNETFLYLEKNSWDQCESISLDYAIMEKVDNLRCIGLTSSWSDLGEWNSIWEHANKDQNGVSAPEKAVVIDCENVLLRSEDSNYQIAAVGLRDLVVSATSDAILVADRHHAQNVKQVVSDLAQRGSKQATSFRKDRRPWGWYDSLDVGDSFQVKHIHINPQSSISLQRHRYRSEHWIIVSGTGIVTVDEKRETVHKGQSVYVPQGAIHRIENSTELPLVFIEVQCGSYLGEDDIERFEDLYDRS